MYRRKNDILPLANNRTYSAGLDTSPSLSKRLSKLQPFTKFTYIWLLTSLCSFLYGLHHCRQNIHWTDILCNSEGCRLDYSPPRRHQHLHQEAMSNVFVPRHALDSTHIVCVNHSGELIEKFEGDCGKAGSKTFNSYTLEYYDSNSHLEDKNASINKTIFVVRRTFRVVKYRNRSEHNRLRMYIEGKTTTFKVKDDEFVTWQGLVGITFGLMSAIFCLVFGQFQNSIPRAGKYAPRRR